MARNTSENERLPSWELRLTIWQKQLRLDMKARNVITNLDDSITQFHDAISVVNGIPSDSKTFSNWIQKKNYPQGSNLENLLDASEFSGRWLITKQLNEPLHRFLNSLDYCLCALNPEKNPSLFKKSERNAFADQCLTEIAMRWRIPFVSNEEEFDSSKYHQVQDVSLSMLKTHGISAIPFYLCSLATIKAVSDEDLYSWYMDLLCSTLIVIAAHHNNGIDYSNPSSLLEKYLGTNPNLLASVGEFLLWSDATPMYSFLEASEDDFNEISDCTQLLECILIGNLTFRNKLRELGIELKDLTVLIRSELSKNGASENNLLGRCVKNKISIRSSHSQPFTWNCDDKIVYHLCSDEPTRVSKEIWTREGYKFSRLLPCKSPIKSNDNHYSWGYGGRGVYNLSYTLLYDLFNHKKSVNVHTPKESQIGLLVYKLLSRIDMFCSYSISAEQIIYALNEPIFFQPKQIDEVVVGKFISAITS